MVPDGPAPRPGCSGPAAGAGSLAGPAPAARSRPPGRPLAGFECRPASAPWPARCRWRASAARPGATRRTAGIRGRPPPASPRWQSPSGPPDGRERLERQRPAPPAACPADRARARPDRRASSDRRRPAARETAERPPPPRRQAAERPPPPHIVAAATRPAPSPTGAPRPWARPRPTCENGRRRGPRLERPGRAPPAPGTTPPGSADSRVSRERPVQSGQSLPPGPRARPATGPAAHGLRSPTARFATPAANGARSSATTPASAAGSDRSDRPPARNGPPDTPPHPPARCVAGALEHPPAARPHRPAALGDTRNSGPRDSTARPFPATAWPPGHSPPRPLGPPTGRTAPASSNRTRPRSAASQAPRPQSPARTASRAG